MPGRHFSGELTKVPENLMRNRKIRSNNKATTSDTDDRLLESRAATLAWISVRPRAATARRSKSWRGVAVNAAFGKLARRISKTILSTGCGGLIVGMQRYS